MSNIREVLQAPEGMIPIGELKISRHILDFLISCKITFGRWVKKGKAPQLEVWRLDDG